VVSVQTGTIETRVPARLDRLPWSRFHWLVVVGLGTVWILDGLEVTMVGSVASRMSEKGSGISITAGDIGTAAAIYVAGACLGALFFGHLTDRFGRKKLFIVTLALYIAATTSTAFAISPLYFFAARFFTGAGIGGEYSAINSAIDELIPARVRGRVDLIINGSYWVGSAGGAALSVLLLNTAFLPKDIGWRVAFAVGAILGLTIMLVRRNVPESPRWLFIHGREEEAERIVDGIENDVREETGQELDEPGEALTVRQRETIPFWEIARTAFQLYPKRAVLGLALFVGQAFIYNGITFDLGTLFTGFYKVSSGFVPVFIIIYAVGNFAGPLLLGRLFDTIGRKPMISGSYLGSALLTLPLAWIFFKDIGGKWALEGLIFLTFFLASAGASAAYLTVSEIFPMETRAMAIAFFYAVGTAVGGISGPLLFGHMIGSGSRGLVSIAFLIGAAVMAIGGVVELFYGVKAEQQSLESIAMPLTTRDADEGADGAGEKPGRHDHHATAQQRRERAEQERARAAEHRASAIELGPATEGGAHGAAERREAEELLAELAELRARSLEEQAAAYDELAAAGQDGDGAAAARERAQAAQQRALAIEDDARRLVAVSTGDREAAADYERRAAAANERARLHEQLAMAEEAHAAARDDEGAKAALDRARAQMHEAWARVNAERAAAVAEGRDLDRAGDREGGVPTPAEARGLAAEERVRAAEHRLAAEELASDVARAEQADEQRAAAAERERRAREIEARIRTRLERRQARDRAGARRFRPGPGRSLAAARSLSVGGGYSIEHERALDREIEVIARALDEHGPTDRRELARLVGARYWGPGRFGEALAVAVEEGRARELSRHTYGPPENRG